MVGLVCSIADLSASALKRPVLGFSAQPVASSSLLPLTMAAKPSCQTSFPSPELSHSEASIGVIFDGPQFAADVLGGSARVAVARYLTAATHCLLTVAKALGFAEAKIEKGA